MLVAACYTVVTFSGCALNREYQVSANGVPLSTVYADAAQTTTDVTPGQEEKGWWARNWHYVLLAIVVIGGIAAGIALSQDDNNHKGGAGGTL